MRVTEVKVFPVKDDKLKAFVSVVLDHCFMVNDIKVIEGRDGRFISMPSRRKRNGKFKDVAHPLNSETRRMLEDKILGEYERVLTGDGPSGRSEPLETEATTALETRPSPSTPDRESTEAKEPLGETTTTPESSLEEVTEKHLSDSFWTS